jgi:hypothetical protein
MSVQRALISAAGHVTADELRRYFDRTEAGSGFVNRLVFTCVCRSSVCRKQLADAAGHARKQNRMEMDEQVWAIWHAVYPELSEGLPGLLGAVTSRAEVQVIRLALLYALLDQSSVIQPTHLKAGLAVWEYAEASARHIFGSTLGDPLADDILRSLRAHPESLSRTETCNLFKPHRDRETIGRALELLQQKDSARQSSARPMAGLWRCGVHVDHL